MGLKNLWNQVCIFVYSQKSEFEGSKKRTETHRASLLEKALVNHGISKCGSKKFLASLLFHVRKQLPTLPFFTKGSLINYISIFWNRTLKTHDLPRLFPISWLYVSLFSFLNPQIPISNKGGHIEKEGFKKSGKDYWLRLWKAPNTHIWFFCRDLIGKITPFLSDPGHGLCSLERVTMIIFYDLLKQYIFFLLTCLCVRTHCRPIPCNENMIFLWSNSNSEILSFVRGNPVFIAGETCNENRISLLDPCYTLYGITVHTF